MVLGAIEAERVALNHEWLWRGTNRCRDTEPRAGRLEEVRRLLSEGRYAEATQKGNEAFGSVSGRREAPNHVDPYRPAGHLHIALDHGPRVDDCRRELDLQRACAR